MSRAPPRFRQADIERAVRAANRTGQSIAKIEIDPSTGKISILIAGGADPAPTGLDAAAAAFDEWEKENARQAQGPKGRH
jgi:hypothetical protein